MKPLSIMLSVSRLLHHMGHIFQNQAPAPSGPDGVRIDRKRLQQLRAKKIAMGHKANGAPELPVNEALMNAAQGWYTSPTPELSFPLWPCAPALLWRRTSARRYGALKISLVRADLILRMPSLERYACPGFADHAIMWM